MSGVLSRQVSTGRRVLRRAAVLGMSQEVRDAWDLLVRRLQSGPATMLGMPGPNRILLDRARGLGGLEGDMEDEGAPTRRVVIPMTGATPAQMADWEKRGHELIDLTLPSIRRARAMVSMATREGDRFIMAGHVSDPECRAIAGDRSIIVESADEILSLPFEPRSTIAFQTCLASQRARVLAETLRGRFRDSRVQVVDTLSPDALARERAVHELVREVDLMVIVADPADAGGNALFEAARLHGRPAKQVLHPSDLGSLREFHRIGLSAGGFTTDDQIEAISRVLK